jgi:hypothetical protein
MKTLILSISVLTFTAISAQNRVLVLDSGETINNRIFYQTDDEYRDWYYDYKYQITPVPQTLKKNLNLEIDYELAANRSLCMFQFTHLYNSRVDFGRSFLDAGYEWYHLTEYNDAPWWYQMRKDTTQRNSLKKEIFGNSIVQELIYNWLMPAYRDAFSIMSTSEQQAFMQMFREGRTFADTFNLETQTQVVADNYNYADVVGSMNAFIYRRVANK